MTDHTNEELDSLEAPLETHEPETPELDQPEDGSQEGEQGDDPKDPEPEPKEVPALFYAFKPQELTEEERNTASMMLLVDDTEVDEVARKHYPAHNDPNHPDMLNALMTMKMRLVVPEGKVVHKKTPAWPITAPSGRRAGIMARTTKLPSGEVKGEAALLAITSVFGNGTRYQMPLINSGFRVEVAVPPADDFCWLEEGLVENMGNVGRLTAGASFSNTKAFLWRDIVNFFLKTIRAHNIEGVGARDVQTLKTLISPDDYESILTLLTVMQKPNGWSTVVPCQAPKCNHVVDGITNPAKLLLVDHGKLTDEQLNQITQPITEAVTVEQLEKYQRAFVDKLGASTSWVKGEHRLTVHLSKGNMTSHIEAAASWAGGINKAINQHMQQSDDAERRARITQRLLTINSLTEFMPYIDRLEITKVDDGLEEAVEEPMVVTDAQTILDTLKRFYNDSSVQDAMDKVRDYVVDTNPVYIGVPRHQCPSCGNIPETEIIPVDIESQFFIHGLGGKTAIQYTATAI